MRLEVGGLFPGRGPAPETAHLELWADGGLTLLINYPQITQDELRTFRNGLAKYIYLEAPGAVPVAYWIFVWSQPFGEVEVPFDARIVEPKLIQDYLDTSDGVKNALQIILLNGQQIASLKLVGLAPAAVEQFHSTIQRQLAADYTRQDFDHALASLQAHDVQTLMAMGTTYRHRG